MPDNTHSETMPEDVAQNSGDRNAAIDANPAITLEEARNAAAGEGPNGAGGAAVSDVESHVPGSSDPSATDLPSANAPDPTEVSVHNVNSAQSRATKGGKKA